MSLFLSLSLLFILIWRIEVIKGLECYGYNTLYYDGEYPSLSDETMEYSVMNCNELNITSRKMTMDIPNLAVYGWMCGKGDGMVNSSKILKLRGCVLADLDDDGQCGLESYTWDTSALPVLSDGATSISDLTTCLCSEDKCNSAPVPPGGQVSLGVLFLSLLHHCHLSFLT